MPTADFVGSPPNEERWRPRLSISLDVGDDVASDVLFCGVDGAGYALDPQGEEVQSVSAD